MKKILIAVIALTVCNANAEEYGTYIDEDIEFTESADSYDTYSTVCNCDCDCNKRQSKYDNYTGFRIYKNEHSAYAYTLPNGHHDTYTTDNFGFGTVLGNRLTDWARVEYETLYMGAQYSKHNHHFDYDIWGNFLNAYTFHEFDHAVAPYVGAGLGLSGIWGEIDGELDNAFDLSYQAMVGVLFELNSRIELDLGFKYVNFGRVKHDDAVSKVDATQIYLGASYKFGM